MVINYIINYPVITLPAVMKKDTFCTAGHWQILKAYGWVSEGWETWEQFIFPVNIDIMPVVN